MPSTTDRAETRRPEARQRHTGRRRGWRANSDSVFQFIAYVLLGLFAVSILYPLIYVVSSSLSSAEAIGSGEVHLLPVGFNVDAYATIIVSPAIVTGFANSLFYAASGAVLGTALTVLAGYPLSRPDLVGRRGLLFFALLPTLLSAGIIPTYIVVHSLGLLNTRWAIVLPAAMSIFNVIITRTFYHVTIPAQVFEAARIDGANEYQILLRIVLPLSKPILAVNLLFYAIAQWNGWFPAMIYLTDTNLYPLQLVLRNILINNSLDASQVGGADAAEIIARRELFDKLKYALIVVAMLPPLVVYPFVQKHFVKGTMIGSVK